MKNEQQEVLIAWTTVETQDAANKLAQGAVGEKLAACAQVSGPIQSWYHWKGEVMNEAEYRIVFKFNDNTQDRLAAWIQEHHPYDCPQWVVVRAESSSPEYAEWVNSNL